MALLLVAALVGCSGQPVYEQPSVVVDAVPTPTPEAIATPKPKPSVLPKAKASAASTKSVKKPSTPTTTPKPTPKPEPEIKAHTPVRNAVSGSCECPYDTDKRGRSCGGRSAYSRPGGDAPKCYADD